MERIADIQIDESIIPLLKSFLADQRFELRVIKTGLVKDLENLIDGNSFIEFVADSLSMDIDDVVDYVENYGHSVAQDLAEEAISALTEE